MIPLSGEIAIPRSIPIPKPILIAKSGRFDSELPSLIDYALETTITTVNVTRLF